MLYRFYFWQFLGWGLFGLINILARGLSFGFSLGETLATLMLMATGLVVSTALAKFYRNFEQWHWSLATQVVSVILASLLAGVLFSLLTLLLLEPFAGALFSQPSLITSKNVLSNVITLWLVMLIWSGLYFGLKQYRSYLQLKRHQRAMDKSLRSASLDALVNQLNPHFMFNTLNNIRALILEDTEAARRALTHLSDMYRYTLNTDLTQLVTLDEELQVVTDYLHLMHIQLEDRLEVNWQVAQECRSLSVPRMMVQLLVENAIKHGISRRQNGGCIFIEASCIDCFRIRVSNDGKLSKGNTQSTGLGLGNLRRRLTLLYENKASFELREIEGRVIAELILPRSKERQDDH